MAATERPGKIGILAGGGALPVTVAEALTGEGREICVVGLTPDTDERLERFAFERSALGTVGKTHAFLKREGCDAVLMAGNVARPDFSKLKLDWKGAALLPGIVAAARRGDDALLRAVVQAFEREGFAVIGVQDVFDRLLAPQGPIGRLLPSEEQEADVVAAARIVHALGRFDVGQGAVVCRGLPLAVEAAEGTDEMLARCAGLPEALRGTASSRAGALVKLPKPGQERRVDLPTIGVPTVEGAAAAGLAGIAVQRGASLLIDREGIAAAADKHGLFVVGMDLDVHASDADTGGAPEAEDG